MRKILIAIAMASTAMGGGAFAQSDAPPPAGQMPPPPPRGGGWGGGMMAADANHDGIVTREEAIAAADRRFDAMDANHDGTISADEMAAYRDAAMARRGDGATPPPPPGGPRRGGERSITRADYRARTIERFDRQDANHDGKIDRTEMANMREMRQVDRRERDGAPPPPRRRHPPASNRPAVRSCYSHRRWPMVPTCCSSTTNDRSANRSRSI